VLNSSQAFFSFSLPFYPLASSLRLRGSTLVLDQDNRISGI
jgi:hypothetical protein